MTFLSRCFEPRGGKLSYKEKVALEFFGVAVFLIAWQIVYELALFSTSILPSIASVVAALFKLLVDGKLMKDIGYSLALNVLGLIEAAVICLPLGLILGRMPGPRAMSERIVTSARYVPMTAAIGVFIGLFGIHFNMKLQFLAVSIMVFLLPQVVYHIDQVPQVLIDTMTTLGASRWQVMMRLFLPAIKCDFYFSVISLSAISWTYIVVAETVNAQQGIGALAYSSGRQGKMDIFWAAMLIIGVIGYCIDKLGVFSGRCIFSYKFKKKGE